VLRELLVRKQALDPWDRRLNEKAGLEDIDLLSFRDVLQQIGYWNPSVSIEDYFSENMTVSDFVPSLGGTRPLGPCDSSQELRPCIVRKTADRFFPGAWTKVSLLSWKGSKASRPLNGMKLPGTILTRRGKVLELLRSYNSTLFDKESSGPNAPKYPERALQEAVINAIVHRDYEQAEPTSITVFTDRVEIRSPGSLPRSVNKQKIPEGDCAAVVAQPIPGLLF